MLKWRRCYKYTPILWVTELAQHQRKRRFRRKVVVSIKSKHTGILEKDSYKKKNPMGILPLLKKKVQNCASTFHRNLLCVCMFWKTMLGIYQHWFFKMQSMIQSLGIRIARASLESVVDAFCTRWQARKGWNAGTTGSPAQEENKPPLGQLQPTLANSGQFYLQMWSEVEMVHTWIGVTGRHGLD